MAYGDFKDLNRKTFADKLLRDKASNIVKDPKYDGYQRGLASTVYKCFDKKTSGSAVKNTPIKNQLRNYRNQLLENLIKEKYTPLLLTIFGGAALEDMQLINKFNKTYRFLLCVINIYNKYASVTPLKDKKDITFTYVFQNVLDESNRKPNKIWLDKSWEFYNISMESWLEKK